MQKILTTTAVFVSILIIINACQGDSSTENEAYATEWLGASKTEILDNIEDQFQGFSRTMTETAYRYHELYWAGQDQNWEYAEYQREHIEEAMELGFLRRPDREASSQQFMSQALPNMKRVISEEDKEKFLTEFTSLTASCNTCHAMEEVAFMTVKIPPKRNTVIYF